MHLYFSIISVHFKKGNFERSKNPHKISSVIFFIDKYKKKISKQIKKLINLRSNVFFISFLYI